jgi:hypothetical protein
MLFMRRIMKSFLTIVLFLFLHAGFHSTTVAQEALPLPDSSRTVAQTWMEAMLFCIKQDVGGASIQARNLYHLSLAMYDAWAVYDSVSRPCFLGKQRGDFFCPFEQEIDFPSSNIDSLRCIAISYAAYHIIFHRFNQTATKGRVLNSVEDLFKNMGYEPNYAGVDYRNGKPEDLGNYIASSIIEFGHQDGAMEEETYEPLLYTPVNDPLRPDLPGPQGLRFPNRWQPLSVRDYLHKRGGDPNLKSWNLILIQSEDIFLTPEWGNVTPFAMKETDAKLYQREGIDWKVYIDPGPPPFIDAGYSRPESYSWNFALVARWSGMLDPAGGVMIDISPGSHGNVSCEFNDPKDYSTYYSLNEGDLFIRNGHKKNPFTKKKYAKNIVPRGDYLRVIAEYWVDAINTVTPPGHWMQNLIELSNHAQFEPKWMGKGEKLPALEWDIKAYLALSGGLHDAGVACWSVKGYYDYVRPISAIRHLASLGQCSDSLLPSFDPRGLPLIPGFIELVQSDDPLAEGHPEHIDKVKLFTWRGPDYIKNPQSDQAGVGWVLAENWWPYQRYSFGTPPFAGYVSGHSTFSTCAAEVLTKITGSPFFPGGIKTFTAIKNEFLEFEEGPSVDVTLQWATYHDAANETCLSRIYGGIHPPCDDFPGRWIGMQVASKAIRYVNALYSGED